MSPDKGRKGKTSGKGGGGKATGPLAVRRRGLVVFGALFIVLFLVVGISVGIGDPTIPSGDVILVQNTPGDVGSVSADKVKETIDVTAAQAEEKAPKPGDPKYEEAKEAAIKVLLEEIWIQGLANEWGIEASEAEVAKELNKIKSEAFKSEAEFKEFLKKTHYTPETLNERVKIQTLSKKLEAALKEKAPTPTQSEIENYYEAAKTTQFTQKASRDVRLVVNKDRKKAEEARDALSKDDSAANWKKVAKQLSEDATTKKSGGLQKGLQEGIFEEPLNAAIFAAPEGQVEGPLKAQRGYTVFEVENSTPESVQELKVVEAQIQSTLGQRLQQEYFTNYLTSFNTTWSSRTFCAPGYVVERCANFKGDGHAATAPEGCYEASPKGGLPEACPAPVSQLVPALPGTVTPLEPRGKPLAQRPVPKKEAGKESEGAAGLPEGAVPAPSGEAPPAEGAPPAEEAPPAEAGE